jgi:hypothetical protein
MGRPAASIVTNSVVRNRSAAWVSSAGKLDGMV